MNEVQACYEGSSGDRTRALYDRLFRVGPAGRVAVNLLRACKNSERAKLYRSGRSRAKAYSTKDWSIGELAEALDDHAKTLGIAWGWGRDEKAVNFENVLYVEVPGAGQVSFHTSHRYAGPDYGNAWDGAKGTAPERIIRYASTVLGIEPPPAKEQENVARQDRPEGADAPPDARGEVRQAEEQQASFDL